MTAARRRFLQRAVRTRFWVDGAAAVVSGVLGVVTLVWKDWIEVTGWDPDHHSGAAEWLVVAILATVSIGAAIAARFEWRRAAPV